MSYVHILMVNIFFLFDNTLELGRYLYLIERSCSNSGHIYYMYLYIKQGCSPLEMVLCIPSVVLNKSSGFTGFNLIIFDITAEFYVNINMFNVLVCIQKL